MLEIIGHRGNGVGPGENTLTNCLAGIIAGADRVEVDVQLIDGKLWARHPRGGRGEPLEPIIRSVNTPMVLHIKRRHLNPWHDRRVLDRLVKLCRPGDTVSSFWAGTLTYAKRRHPKLRTAFITGLADYDLLLSNRLGAQEYHAWHRTLLPGTARRAKRRDVSLVAFTPSATQQKRLADRLAAVITDDVRGWQTK